MITLPLLSIKTVHDDKLRDVQAGKLLTGTLGYDAVYNHWYQQIHLPIETTRYFQRMHQLLKFIIGLRRICIGTDMPSITLDVQGRHTPVLKCGCVSSYGVYDGTE